MLTEGERVEHIDAATGKIWFSVDQSNFLDEVRSTRALKIPCSEAAYGEPLARLQMFVASILNDDRKVEKWSRFYLYGEKA